MGRKQPSVSVHKPVGAAATELVPFFALRSLNVVERPSLSIVQAFEKPLECFGEQMPSYRPGITRARHWLGIAHDEHIGSPHLLVDQAALMLEEQFFPDAQDVSEEVHELHTLGVI
jgi:hypothetical protein